MNQTNEGVRPIESYRLFVIVSLGPNWLARLIHPSFLIRGSSTVLFSYFVDLK